MQWGGRSLITSSTSSSQSATTLRPEPTHLAYVAMVVDVTERRGASRSPTPNGNTRVTGKEQFFTPRPVADAVVKKVLDVVPDATNRTWLEPAGGTGVFIDAVRAVGVLDVVSFDIEPRHQDVSRGDFLRQQLSVKRAVSVGNPPFGRNNALSVPFFNQCAHYSDFIAFIVPRSWRKWSVTNRLDTRFHLCTDDDLAISYVDAEGAVAYTRTYLQTCIQIWERRDHSRPKVKVLDRGIVAKCAPEDADVALTIFGFGCGTVKTDFPRRKVTTELYLTLTHPRALEALRAVDYQRFSRNVAYTDALSIQEINYLLNEYLFDDPGMTTAPAIA
jgi:predicted RNA methylase